MGGVGVSFLAGCGEVRFRMCVLAMTELSAADAVAEARLKKRIILVAERWRWSSVGEQGEKREEG
jgi:hypothetical protein